MGCAGSKLDDLEAVALCRHRLRYLAEAIEHRYALADAHASYVRSLRSIGLSLHRFFLVTDVTPPSPVLTLPPQRKGDPLPPHSLIYHLPPPSPRPAAIPDSGTAVAPETGHRLWHSNSSSHLQFRSSGDEDDDDGSLRYSEHSSPLHHNLDIVHEGVTATTKTYFNFVRKGPPASAATYEQRVFSTDVNPVQVGGGDPTAVPPGLSYPYHHADPYFNQNQNYYGGGSGYPYVYSHPYPPSYGATGDGLFGSSQPPTMSPPPPAATSPSSRTPPPQPPSPPSTSSWDFLNPFETYENYRQTYTPSLSSRDLGEEEGVPDLEDEEQEVINEAYGDEKYAAGASTSATKGSDLRSTGESVAVEEGGRSVGEEMDYQARSSGTGEGKVHLTEKNAVADEVLQRQSEGGLWRKAVPGSRSVPDAVHEIRAQFDRASASCEEMSKMLEVEKLPYHRRKYEAIAPTKTWHAIISSLTTTATSLISTSNTSNHPDSASLLHLDFDDEKGVKSGSHSSTLQKLYIWEKKLLEEVKAEETMRLHYDRKSKRLMRLSGKGAENHKIDLTRGLVMKLSSKIRIAIEVVDSISNRIGKLRDEELWPQLYELIQGLIKMWKVMSECHRNQCHAVIESKSLDAVVSAFAGNIPDAHMDATMHLGLELLNWINIFFSWFDAQKCYVRTLNGWLMKCLPEETEETTDGIAPFSPGRLGAPPVFVICHHWSQIIDKISEREVVKSMWSFTSGILQVWQRRYEDSHRRMLTNREMDRHLKALEKDDQKIHKAMEALNRRLAIVASQSGIPCAGEIIHLNQATEVSGLQRTLQETFEAMKRFSESCMKVYEELGVQFEEEYARA